MIQIAETELVEIGRKAASQVAGLGTVDRVKVMTGQDSSERPAYFFSFLIDQDRALFLGDAFGGAGFFGSDFMKTL